MEVLGRIIDAKCSNNLWNLVKAFASSRAFSHLFFADDLLLFAKANSLNCESVRDAIKEVSMISG